jgi:hypothetical protein
MHAGYGEQWLFIPTAPKFKMTHPVCYFFFVRDSNCRVLYLFINGSRMWWILATIIFQSNINRS